MSQTLRLLAGSALFSAMASIALADPVTVTHAQGELTIEAVPETVIVTDWAAFDNLSALGVAVAGVPGSNAPAYLVDQVAADALKVGSLQEPDIEGIAAAEPDLVIIGARSRTSFPVISGIAPTIDASIDNGTLIEGVETRLTQYGEIFGKTEEAAALIASLDAKVEEAKAAVEGKGTGLVIVTNAGKIGVYGPQSRVAWIYTTLNMPSVYDTVDDRDHGGDGISFEYLLETNPDWLFVVDRDAGVGNEGAARALLDNELIHQTSFWQKGQIVYLEPQAAYVTMHGYQGLILLLDQVLAAFNEAG
ncbi:siderophore ABC transporter substrate-binding protein [Pseudogemmobacter sonorensis]|uniref:siderophore ABC transporter substrate-binding protein n=1 Tax=Pseudogemmobacter sonorensis TaxID=2989681 RepID=UPI0036890E3A